MNPDDAIKKILDHAKPDQMQALEALKKANDTIQMLSNQVKIAEASWTEQFIILATILNHFDREVVLTEEDMIALSPHDYAVTVEPNEETGERIVRLRHITQPEAKVDNGPDPKSHD